MGMETSQQHRLLDIPPGMQDLLASDFLEEMAGSFPGVKIVEDTAFPSILHIYGEEDSVARAHKELSYFFTSSEVERNYLDDEIDLRTLRPVPTAPANSTSPNELTANRGGVALLNPERSASAPVLPSGLAAVAGTSASNDPTDFVAIELSNLIIDPEVVCADLDWHDKESYYLPGNGTVVFKYESASARREAENELEICCPGYKRRNLTQTDWDLMTKKTKVANHISLSNGDVYNNVLRDKAEPVLLNARVKKKRDVVIDCQNVCRTYAECTGNPNMFDCQGAKLAVDYFERRGHKVFVVVPTMKIDSRHDPSIINQDILKQLKILGKIVPVMHKRNENRRVLSPYDDLTILETAAESDGVLLSNDNMLEICNDPDTPPEYKEVILHRRLTYSFARDLFIMTPDPNGPNGPRAKDILEF